MTSGAASQVRQLPDSFEFATWTLCYNGIVLQVSKNIPFVHHALGDQYKTTTGLLGEHTLVFAWWMVMSCVGKPSSGHKHSSIFD